MVQGPRSQLAPLSVLTPASSVLVADGKPTLPPGFIPGHAIGGAALGRRDVAGGCEEQEWLAQHLQESDHPFQI